MVNSALNRNRTEGLVEDPPGVVIHRSSRRRKTVQAHVDGDVMHVYLPDNLSRKRELEWIEEMRRSIRRKEETKGASSEIDLEARARLLNRRFFGDSLRWKDIRFTPVSKTRYGWCRPATGEIRISSELTSHPKWVMDYVIVHELAHLVFADHSKDFWRLVAAYPKAERARGYLDGFARAGGHKRAVCDGLDDLVRARRPRTHVSDGQLTLIG